MKSTLRRSLGINLLQASSCVPWLHRRTGKLATIKCCMKFSFKLCSRHWSTVLITRGFVCVSITNHYPMDSSEWANKSPVEDTLLRISVLGSIKLTSTITGVMKNNSMGKTQFTPDRYRFSDSRGYCEVYQEISDSHQVSSDNWNLTGDGWWTSIEV